MLDTSRSELERGGLKIDERKISGFDRWVIFRKHSLLPSTYISSVDWKLAGPSNDQKDVELVSEIYKFFVNLAFWVEAF